MSILPKNEPKETVDTPQNFFIYGETMSGKSYLAGEFPNPLFLDTDGNAQANPYPSIELRNVRAETGKIKNGASIVDQLDQIVLELQTTKHTYETVILDVIDDIIVMIEQYVCDKMNVDALADAPYGKGYAMVNSIVQSLVIDLKTLPMNVIYVSRFGTYEDNGVRVEVPSLKDKYINIVNGNCDLMIQTAHIGKNYLRVVKNRRKSYTPDKIGDPRIQKILATITGAFDRTKPTPKKEQDQIFKQREAVAEQQRKDVAKQMETTQPEASPKTARRPKPVIK